MARAVPVGRGAASAQDWLMSTTAIFAVLGVMGIALLLVPWFVSPHDTWRLHMARLLILLVTAIGCFVYWLTMEVPCCQ